MLVHVILLLWKLRYVRRSGWYGNERLGSGRDWGEWKQKYALSWLTTRTHACLCVHIPQSSAAFTIRYVILWAVPFFLKALEPFSSSCHSHMGMGPECCRISGSREVSSIFFKCKLHVSIGSFKTNSSDMLGHTHLGTARCRCHLFAMSGVDRWEFFFKLNLCCECFFMLVNDPSTQHFCPVVGPSSDVLPCGSSVHTTRICEHTGCLWGFINRKFSMSQSLLHPHPTWRAGVRRREGPFFLT